MNPNHLSCVIALLVVRGGNDRGADVIPMKATVDDQSKSDQPEMGSDACKQPGNEFSLKPPVYGRIGDGWPRKVGSVGVVTGLLPGYCGLACNAATLQIRLLKPVPGYSGMTVY